MYKRAFREGRSVAMVWVEVGCIPLELPSLLVTGLPENPGGPVWQELGLAAFRACSPAFRRYILAAAPPGARQTSFCASGPASGLILWEQQPGGWRFPSRMRPQLDQAVPRLWHLATQRIVRVNFIGVSLSSDVLSEKLTLTITSSPSFSLD